MRRKVPNVCRERSRITRTNLTSDKLSDVKQFYGWTEHQLEQNVRAHTGELPQREQRTIYEQAYGKKQ